jgi:hypothetical protein
MPRDRIKLADAKALIADGHATPESIAANFDVEDDGSGEATPAASATPTRLETARARVATPTLDRLGLTGADVKARVDHRKPLIPDIGGPAPSPDEFVGAGVDAVTGVADALGGLVGLTVDVATVAPRRSLAAAREFARTRSASAAYRASQNEPFLPVATIAEGASDDFRKTARTPSLQTLKGGLERPAATRMCSSLISPQIVRSFDDTGTSVAAPYIQFEAPPEIARELKPLEAASAPAGEAITPSVAADGQATAQTSAAASPEGAASSFDAQTYVREQVAAREAARKAGAPSGVLGKGRSLLADLKAKLVDSNAPIEDLLADTVKKEKIKLPPSRDITNSIDRVYRAPSIAGQFARDNGIESVIREVPDLDTLDQYLIAKQARTIEASGRATGRDLAADAKFVESQAAVYEPFAAQVSDYSRKLLDYVTESGLISKDLAAHLKETYPDYVPLQRVFSEIESTGAQGTGKSVASISGQTVVRKLKGSQREIESPIESMMSKTTDAFTQRREEQGGKAAGRLPRTARQPVSDRGARRRQQDSDRRAHVLLSRRRREAHV